MILRCSFEEIGALTSGIEGVLASSEGGGVAAPPEVLADVEALLPRLSGDLSVATYAEQQSLERAVLYVLENLRVRMDDRVLDEYPAAEAAVLAYFDYAHALSVYDRLLAMGSEMSALIELMTGSAPTVDTADRVTFPD